MSKRTIVGILAALALGAATDAWSQATGTVTGLVRDVGSLAPVSAAQVYIPQLEVGSLTQANGRYLLVNVPAGTHTIQAERIGYRTISQQVTVVAGQSAEANFALEEDALALDEIVVTGTAGQARRREVGNQIVQLNLAEVAEPVRDVGTLLQGRVAGARITTGGGSSGGGMDIRLRGNVSVAMSNQPLIYVDGIRMKSEPYPRLASDDYVSPLNDINPDDIERIEIVKGPAATTLYGTEAAAGVIQIFTKRGGAGSPQWTAETQQGFAYMRGFATDEVPFYYVDPVMRNGHRQRYSLSVRGGAADRLGYFASSAWDDNDGVIQHDWQKQLALRGNMQFRPHEDWLVQFNNSLTSTDIRNQVMGNSITGIMMAGMRGDRGYMRSRKPETLRLLLEPERLTNIDRFISGVTLNFTPSTSFMHRLTLGYDFSQYEKSEVTPYDWRTPTGVLGDLGTIDRTSNQHTVRSIDYVGTLGFNLTSNFRSAFSWGFQGQEDRDERIFAEGDDFPGPGDYTINSTARKSSEQYLIKVITGGFFFQDMLSLSDRYFLTLGLRVDGNSAFGEDLGLEPYPKVSMSYVLSDEAFWPESFGTMKLRAAYGLAGRAPGAFDKVRTWEPVGWGLTQAAFVPENLGNPKLGPERTAELELGFDASVLNDRVTAEFTYFSRNTTDALFRVSRPAVQGDWEAQLENVGKIKTSGIELGLNARVLDWRSLAWDVGGAISTNDSEVVSLGGAPEFSVGNRAWIIEGQPVPVFRGYKLMNFWDVAEPVIEKDQIIGRGYPPHIINLSTSFTLPGGITLSGRGEYQGPSYIWHIPEAAVLDRNIPYPTCYDAYRKADPTWEVGPIGAERTAPKPPATAAAKDAAGLLAWERAKCFGLMQPARYDLVITPLAYFELRELTLNIPVSSLFPSLTSWSSRTDLTVSMRNVWYWRNRELMAGHPEGLEGGNIASHEIVRRLGETLPPASFFTVSLRAIF